MLWHAYARRLATSAGLFRIVNDHAAFGGQLLLSWGSRFAVGAFIRCKNGIVCFGSADTHKRRTISSSFEGVGDVWWPLTPKLPLLIEEAGQPIAAMPRSSDFDV